MIIQVNDEVFEESDEVIAKLDKFFHTINDRHFWLIDSYKNIETIRDSKWYKGLRPMYKNLIDNYIISSATKKKIDVLKIANTDENFNIDEAIVYLSQPLIVILENSFNDGKFINAIIKAFPEKGIKISKHIENKWLEYGNGNGCTGIVNFIKEKLNNYQNLPNKNKNKYLKCFVIVDSDSKFREMPFSNGREILVDFLNENSIEYHILEKREIENYLPDEVIATIEGNDDFIQAYLKMKSPFQKDYFDLENGFPDKRFNDFDTNIQTLYSDLIAIDINTFRKQKMKIEGGYKNKMPDLFSHKLITKDALLNKTKHQIKDSKELETILIKISKLL